MLSEVQPKGSVSKDTSKGKHAPHGLVCLMSLRSDGPSGELRFGWDSWENLASFVIEIDHVEHDLAGLVLVRHLSDQRHLVWLNRLDITISGVVRLVVLSFGVTSVQKSADGASVVGFVVSSLILQIVRNPTAVHKNGLFLTC